MNLQSDMPSDMAGEASLAGFRLYPGHFDRPGQVELLAAVREVLQTAPLFTPRMPKSGRPFSVRMSNCGPLGWVSDESGYRYQASHPETGRPWPPIPPALMALWSALARFRGPPEACLINFYGAHAKMGLHQDRDELEFDAPVISISLGDSCLFRVGGRKRRDPTRSVRLSSGDVLRARRRRAPCLSRRRPDLSGHIKLAPGGRTDQSNAAPGDTQRPRPADGPDTVCLKHDPEKWEPVFGKDHAQTKR